LSYQFLIFYLSIYIGRSLCWYL